MNILGISIQLFFLKKQERIVELSTSLLSFVDLLTSRIEDSSHIFFQWIIG